MNIWVCFLKKNGKTHFNPLSYELCKRRLTSNSYERRTRWWHDPVEARSWSPPPRRLSDSLFRWRRQCQQLGFRSIKFSITCKDYYLCVFFVRNIIYIKLNENLHFFCWSVCLYLHQQFVVGIYNFCEVIRCRSSNFSHSLPCVFPFITKSFHNKHLLTKNYLAGPTTHGQTTGPVPTTATPSDHQSPYLPELLPLSHLLAIRGLGL